MSLTENPVPHPQAAVNTLPAPPPRDPVWNGWDVVMIVVVALLGLFVFTALIEFGLLLAGHPIDPGAPPPPKLMLLAQFLSYIVVLAFMGGLLIKNYHDVSAQRIPWIWPRIRGLLTYLAGGILLAVIVELVSLLLPIPKTLPIDRYFQNPGMAYMMSVFGVTMAPLVEELFFRGFLYPVAARWTSRVLSTPSLSLFSSVATVSVLFAGLVGYVVHPRWLWAVGVFFLISLLLYSTGRRLQLVRQSFQPLNILAVTAALTSVVGSLIVMRNQGLGNHVNPVWSWLVVLLFFVALALFAANRDSILLEAEFSLVFVPAFVAALWFLICRIAPQSVIWPISALVLAFVVIDIVAVCRRMTPRETLTIGIIFGIAGTALGFALVHASQLAHAWAPLLILFIVGLVFTLARVVTRNVAPGFLMHVGYNLTLFVGLYIATDRFRHMERMLQ